MNNPTDTNQGSHRHIFRRGIDNDGGYNVCECGFKKYDTNQASEDVLKDQIDDVFARACKNNEYFGYDGWYELHTPTMRVEIKALIRTEKLKLLDEVRERVVGEDEPGITNIMIAAEHAEQMSALNKLEAEL